MTRTVLGFGVVILTVLAAFDGVNAITRQTAIVRAISQAQRSFESAPNETWQLTYNLLHDNYIGGDPPHSAFWNSTWPGYADGTPLYKYWSGLPFCYGGESLDNVAQQQIYNGYGIGAHRSHYDVRGSTANWAAGADCAKLVSWASGIPGLSTWNLVDPTISTEIQWTQLVRGDWLVKPPTSEDPGDSKMFLYWDTYGVSYSYVYSSSVANKVVVVSQALRGVEESMGYRYFRPKHYDDPIDGSWGNLKALYSGYAAAFSTEALSSQYNTVVWNRPEQVPSEYYIYRSEGEAGDLTYVATQQWNDTVFVDSTTVPGALYKYAVATTDGDTFVDLGNYSAGLKAVNETMIDGVSWCYGAAKRGSYLYLLTDEPFDLIQVDVADPGFPVGVAVGDLGPNFNTFVGMEFNADGYLIVLTSKWLHVLDESLTVLGSIQLCPGGQSNLSCNDFAFDHSYPFVVYVACGDLGVKGVNIFDPSLPQECDLFAGAVAPGWQTYKSVEAFPSLVGDYLYLRSVNQADGSVVSEIVRAEYLPVISIVTGNASPSCNGNIAYTTLRTSEDPSWPPGLMLEPVRNGRPSSKYAIAEFGYASYGLIDVTDPLNPIPGPVVDLDPGGVGGVWGVHL